MSELVEMRQIPMIRTGLAEHWLRRAKEEAENAGVFNKFSIKKPPAGITQIPKGDKIPITVVTCCLLAGGAENQSVSLAIELDALGFDVTFLNVGASAGFHNQFCIRLKESGIKYTQTIDFSEQFAVIWWGTSLLDYADNGGKIPNSIYVAHSAGLWTHEAVVKVKNHINYGVGVCGPAAELVSNLAGVKSEVIWNGVPLDEVSPDPHRKERSGPEDEFVVGYLGRYSPEKNLVAAIGALKHLPRNVRLRMYGWGYVHTDLFSIASEYHVDSRVDIGGTITDKSKAFAEFDCLVLSSVYEGFPMTVIEAMFTGVPCVVVPHGDLSLVCEDNLRGITVNGNEHSVASGIMRLVDKPSLATEIAENATQFAHTHLTAKAMGARYANLILGMK